MKSDRGRGCRRPRLASAGGRRSDAFQKKQNNNKKDKRKAHEEVNKCRIKSAALKGQCSCVPHRHLQLGLGRGRVRVPGDVDLRDPFGGRWPRPSPERPLRPGGVLHSGDPRLEPVWARHRQAQASAGGLAPGASSFCRRKWPPGVDSVPSLPTWNVSGAGTAEAKPANGPLYGERLEK